MKWWLVVKQNPVKITAPDLGTSRAKFSLWYVSRGDRVCEGDRVAEVSIPGAIIDIQSPASGILIEKHSYPNDLIIPGQVLGVVEEE
jgi:pyruvate/2-oxoglutarate dehydrogenase complex dihydrolipoamide acyltransferase (E2) component